MIDANPPAHMLYVIFQRQTLLTLIRLDFTDFDIDGSGIEISQSEICTGIFRKGLGSDQAVSIELGLVLLAQSKLGEIVDSSIR